MNVHDGGFSRFLGWPVPLWGAGFYNGGMGEYKASIGGRGGRVNVAVGKTGITLHILSDGVTLDNYGAASLMDALGQAIRAYVAEYPELARRPLDGFGPDEPR